MQMYIEVFCTFVVCFFVNKLTPSLMTQESILGYLCAPNGVQKLCTLNGVQMGYKMGYKMGSGGEFVS